MCPENEDTLFYKKGIDMNRDVHSLWSHYINCVSDTCVLSAQVYYFKAPKYSGVVKALYHKLSILLYKGCS